MTSSSSDSLFQVVNEFDISGEFEGVQRLDRGHIHDTFVSSFSTPYGRRRFLHQRLNDNVFQDVPALMYNIERVTKHMHASASEAERGLATLRLVATKGGGTYHHGEQGHWRTYRFIEGTESFDLCRNEEHAYSAASAFGNFQRRLQGLHAGDLKMTLPRFFSSSYRLEEFDTALGQDQAERGEAAGAEVDFIQSRREQFGLIDAQLEAGAMPTRVIHGDTKLNNILFDRGTGAARCIVDLDTCMPGYSLYDFGDLVRFTAATSREDETDLAQVGTDLGLYRALVKGYLTHTREFLTPGELELMPFAARLVTMTVGTRFLTDHLNGDKYFKVSHEGHNLERARVQFRMVERMEELESEMRVE